MESSNVKEIYEQIATRFDHTRAYYWKGIKDFINELPTHSLIFDAGCGNGKHMLLRPDCYFVGQDFCINSIIICKNKNLNVFINNIKNITVRDNCFDAVICVAVIHHLETIQNRLQAINELYRSVKKDGLIFIQVWATEAVNSKQFIKIKDNDYFVTWYVNKNTKVNRYYHLFTKDELIHLCIECKIKIIDVYFERNNWILIGKK